MRKIILLVILSVFLHSLQARLLYTFNVIRHGANYPKNDLYDGNETKKFRGLLTPIGLRQQYNLGTYIKSDYISQQELMTPKFTPNQVEFFSTSYERTQKSILAFLYGLFPLEEGWTIPQGIPQDKFDPPYTPSAKKILQQELLDKPFALNKGFQALPVRPIDEILDYCPNYNTLRMKRLKQIEGKLHDLELKQALQIQRIKGIFNLTLQQTNLDTLSDLYQTLYSDQYLGRAWPKEYNNLDHQKLEDMFYYYNTLIFGGNFAKILSTPVLRFIRAKLQGSVLKKNTNLKATFITCHSSNIWPLLTLFNMTSPECLNQKQQGNLMSYLNCVTPPEFAANLIFELHENGLQHYIRVLYNGYYVNLCQRQETACFYEQFVDRIKNIQVNYEKQCFAESMIVDQE